MTFKIGDMVESRLGSKARYEVLGVSDGHVWVKRVGDSGDQALWRETFLRPVTPGPGDRVRYKRNSTFEYIVIALYGDSAWVYCTEKPDITHALPVEDLTIVKGES